MNDRIAYFYWPHSGKTYFCYVDSATSKCYSCDDDIAKIEKKHLTDAIIIKDNFGIKFSNKVKPPVTAHYLHGENIRKTIEALNGND